MLLPFKFLERAMMLFSGRACDNVTWVFSGRRTGVWYKKSAQEECRFEKDKKSAI